MDETRTLRRARAGACAAVMAATMGLWACNSPAPLDVGEKDDQNLIGGFVANDPRLDPVGSLVLILPWGAVSPFCTGALLTPETVITATHCLTEIPFIYSLGLKVGFAVGPDAFFPKQVMEIATFAEAPLGSPDYFGMGRDVGVLHLEHPLTGVDTIDIGTLSSADIGVTFAAIGYGVQNNAGSSGTRRVGQQTVAALEGRVFEALFGDFEAFLRWALTGTPPAGLVRAAVGTATDAGATVDAGVATDAVPAPPPSFEDFVREIYDSYLIEPAYEVVTGTANGDAQPCFGDSGGPLLRKVGDRLVSYGVASRVVDSVDLVCDVGAIYDTFGPETMAFLEAEKSWVDVCGDMDSAGRCDGNVATRCTNVVEGRRRVVTFDCGILGMTCNMGSGQVSCDSNPFEPPSPPPPPPGGPLPDIKSRVDNAFRLSPSDAGNRR